MASELIYRGHETQPAPDSYSPKPIKPWSFITRVARYMLCEQRLLFVLVGIAIATLFFTMFPTSRAPHALITTNLILDPINYFPIDAQNKVSYQHKLEFGSRNLTGKISLGLKRKGLRIVITGGAGFVDSHLVDRLIARGNSVIVVDNFFTGNKQNVVHHFCNLNFELIRHDVVEPLLLEVD